MTTQAYPLAWPPGKPRSTRREAGSFKVSFANARDAIVQELSRLKASHMVISSNIPLRRDGLPYADQANPQDPGVAVYFQYRGNAMCFACDRWRKVEHNMRAIALTIEALRGVSRWGTGDMMQAAFSGFSALPPPITARHWRDVLGLDDVEDVTPEELRQRYLRARSSAHSDKGGNDLDFHEVKRAYEDACAELGIVQ